jgi:hypothetical protein
MNSVPTNGRTNAKPNTRHEVAAARAGRLVPLPIREIFFERIFAKDRQKTQQIRMSSPIVAWKRKSPIKTRCFASSRLT